MKLKYYSEQTCPKQMGGGNKVARTTFGKSGVITFNRQSVDLMELSEKDKITIANDEEHPENWYVFKDPKNGFSLRSGYDKNGSLMMNHKKLQQLVCKVCKLNEDESQSFLVAGKPTTINGDKTKYWGLLFRPKV